MKRARRHLGCMAIIARRELAAYFHAPIAYIVGVLFLVLQGFSFWAVVSVLADPSAPAPLGAVLGSFFGGTFLYWTVLVLVVAVISMRLVAEEKRQGTWESLLTAPVSELAVLVGKWLGGLAFYALIWLPTLLYPWIIRFHAPEGAAVDGGPILAAYLGVLLTGVSLLALGVAASVATANQIVAAVISFVASMLLILVGELAEIAPRWLDAHPHVAAVIAHVDMRGHMGALAAGLVPLPAIVFHVSVAVMGLWTATIVAVWGRRRRKEIQGRVLAALLVAVSLACVNVLGGRHALSWDVTAARVNSLDPRTERILAALGDAHAQDGQPVVIRVLPAGLDIFAGVQAEVDRVLERMRATKAPLVLERLDPVLEPGRLEALAMEFAIPIENLRDGGVVVLQRGERRRAVDLLDMAGFGTDELGVGKLARFRAEEALATAIRDIIDPDRPTYCHTVGHGELPMQARDAAGALPSWASIGGRIERDGGRLEPVDALAAGVPEHCRVLIVAGPSQPLSPAEAEALASFLARGGRLLLALSEAWTEATIAASPEASIAESAAASPEATIAESAAASPEATINGDDKGAGRGAGLDVRGFARTGLALVLAEYGLALPEVAVVDPDTAVAGPARWYTIQGYGDHPITASFQGRRLTLWLHPRAVLVAERPASAARAQGGDDTMKTSVLIESSASGWGETDFAALAMGQAHEDAHDIEGPVSIAVAVEAPATGARLVVIGGAHALSASAAAGQGSAGDLLAESALAWLSGRARPMDIGAKTPEHVRLIMSQAELRRTFVVCVVVLPALLSFIGALTWWRRRRA